jgi:hypothetical protein
MKGRNTKATTSIAAITVAVDLWKEPMMVQTEMRRGWLERVAWAGFAEPDGREQVLA